MSDIITLQRDLDEALRLLQQMYFFACGRPVDWRVVEAVRAILTKNQYQTGSVTVTLSNPTQKICDD